MENVNGGGMEKGVWLYPKVMGYSPSERWGHSACYSEGVVYVYGGCCGGMHFSDVLTLDLKTMVWSSLVTVGKQPGTRDSHSAVLVGHKMFVLGGTNGSKKTNDLHILDLSTKEWSQPNFEGTPPSPRESHSITVVNNDKLVVFGGSGEGEGNYLNDLHILDLKSMKWTSPVVSGELPTPRDSHTAVAVDNKLVLYGGDCGDRYLGDIYVLDLDTLIWSKLTGKGSSLGARAGHAAVTIGSKVYVISGVGDRMYYNDVWVLDCNDRSWAQLDVRGQHPQGRFSHSAVVADSDIIVYGGCGEDERPLDELLILQLGAEHPNGRYNISTCKIFGRQWTNETQQSPRLKRNSVGKSMENASTHTVERKANGVSSHQWKDNMNDKEDKVNGESNSSALQNSEILRAKKRRMINHHVLETEADQEEHSQSRHSSPSQSDQEQATTNPNIGTQAANSLFHLKKPSQNGMSLVHHQIPQRNSAHRTSPPDRHFTPIAIPRQLKHDQPLHIMQNGRIHDVQLPISDHRAPQKLTASAIVAIPNLIGAEVHGTVDGAFDSGYLMTANLNGQIFRGILFLPGPGFVARETPPISTPVVVAQPAVVSVAHTAVPISNSSSRTTTFIRPIPVESLPQPLNFVKPVPRGNTVNIKEESNESRVENSHTHARGLHQLRLLFSSGKASNLEENRNVHDSCMVKPTWVHEARHTRPSQSSSGKHTDLQGVVLSLAAPGVGDICSQK